MNVETGGILGFILLVCIVYAIVKTAQSGASTGTKVLWIVVLLLLPFIGFILWLLFGPK
ncbi:MAG TPA: PLDc N-terminal domain-containing protein [Cellvibrio sp.]|nr:PLDc N-terminal domain-containing protein [Cellvibrio sp.]